jgi:uncharacterized membrane protein YeaQ/YmgE (transglycosylase-associated protein family)
MLILGIILFGMMIGAGAQLILGRERGGIDWTMAIVAGLAGSFVGGLLVSLLAGDGIDLRPSGIIGSLLGAVVISAAWRWLRSRNAEPGKPTSRSGNPAKAAQQKKHDAP